ncbi:hypothetical protein [Microtetraspora glauca]|uniref:Uncharacterized protein n=1 Tax=Microtetraspora glauca TaxID=1996 RepID=A0ABV3GTU0_MICGL
MKKIENRIHKAVRRGKSQVAYSAIPQYGGDGEGVSSIVMEAQSLPTSYDLTVNVCFGNIKEEPVRFGWNC